MNELFRIISFREQPKPFGWRNCSSYIKGKRNKGFARCVLNNKNTTCKGCVWNCQIKKAGK